MHGTITNGHVDGFANGFTNGFINGHKNGLGNGFTNGHCDEHSETEIAALEAQNFRNPALQVTPDHKLKMVDAPIEEPGPGEVTLQIKCSGICGWVLRRKLLIHKRRFIF